jgi:hypothetical protein
MQPVNRGKLAVLSMLLLAVALAAFALWWNVIGGQRTLAFWGREGGKRIIAEKATVELLRLAADDADGSSERLTIGGKSYVVVARADITGARGLIHARHSLLEDASFDWEATVPAGDYTLAARFRDAHGATTVAFDFEREHLAYVESGQERKAAAKIVAGWQTFARRHLPAGTKNPAE